MGDAGTIASQWSSPPRPLRQALAPALPRNTFLLFPFHQFPVPRAFYFHKTPSTFSIPASSPHKIPVTAEEAEEAHCLVFQGPRSRLWRRNRIFFCCGHTRKVSHFLLTHGGSRCTIPVSGEEPPSLPCEVTFKGRAEVEAVRPLFSRKENQIT